MRGRERDRPHRCESPQAVPLCGNSFRAQQKRPSRRHRRGADTLRFRVGCEIASTRLPRARAECARLPLRNPRTRSVRLGPEAVAEVRAVVRAEGAEEDSEAEEGVEPEGVGETGGTDDLADDSAPELDEPEIAAEE